jgi:hypothetical protein
MTLAKVATMKRRYGPPKFCFEVKNGQEPSEKDHTAIRIHSIYIMKQAVYLLLFDDENDPTAIHPVVSFIH